LGDLNEDSFESLAGDIFRMKKTILFLCTGNSCRSQMAEGFCRKLRGDEFEPYSAGASLMTHPWIPSHDLRPTAFSITSP